MDPDLILLRDMLQTMLNAALGELELDEETRLSYTRTDGTIDPQHLLDYVQSGCMVILNGFVPALQEKIERLKQLADEGPSHGQRRTESHSD